MLKQLLFFVGVLLPFNLSAQDYVWTGAAGSNDFFDEANWRNPVSDDNPVSGAIEPGVSIDLSLILKDTPQTVVANGDISLGSGSLSVEGASLSGTAFSDGDLSILAEGYVSLSGATPLGATVEIDFQSGLGWVKLPEISPADVLNNHLASFLISGTAAVYHDNIRIDNYYESGALVRPNLSSAAPMIVFDEPELQGNNAQVEVDKVHSASSIPEDLNNAIASFELKRGYMATLAINEDGTGLSKVYIASEEDLLVENLPLNLSEKISFIRVVPWNWVAKKGIGGNVTGLNETWHYKWGNNGVSTIERENVPMAWGKGGADDASDIELYKGKYKTPHVLAFNESDNCDDQSGQWGDLCNTDVAVATYENLMKTGLRLVSPSCRENAPFGWLKEFYDKATAQNIRIDVIGVHWYDWGSNPKNSPNADPQQVFNRFKNYLQRVYDLYQLPIWITEFNANPNRTTAVNKAFMELALPYLESLDYVERYAWYQPNSDVADYYDGSGNYTDVGLVYKNQKSTPSVSDASISVSSNLDGALNRDPLTVFEDYFETYTDGQNLGSFYTVWEGPANAVDASITNDSGSAYEGTKFGKSNNNREDFNLRKTFELEAGKTYVWKLATKMTDGAKHVMKVLPDDSYPTLECFNRDWEEHSVEFTVKEGSVSVTLSLYRWPTKNLYFDNFVLKEKETDTSFEDNIRWNECNFRVYPNPVVEKLNLQSDCEAPQNNRIDIVNINGEKVLEFMDYEAMDVSSLTSGLYFLIMGNQTVKFLKR
ncbi:glycosyl hydrolase [Marinilabilia rubra]|nr:glycosyl hydrolase [Marinilabilia rubra]